MAHFKLLISGCGLAILAACSTTPEPICDRDVQIDKYGNVQLAECDNSDAPGAVARGPFPLDWFSPRSPFDVEQRDRNLSRDKSGNDGGITVVLSDAGGDPAPLPTDSSNQGTPTNGDAPAPDDTPTNGGGGTPTDGGGGTPTDGGNGTPTDGGGDDGNDQPDDTGKNTERKELHHALRDAVQQRRAVNEQEVLVRAQIDQTTDADEKYELRQQVRALREERRELQAIQDQRQEEFDAYLESQSN